ncbi:MAG: type II secretion system protein [Campylobacteraceae bacterium]|nr:type II secretion system protein [Campylobacteraceae bacterium]
MKIKKAFTMIELVLIIVVVGILATAVIPRTDRNAVLEAANQVVSHIRYTQHLAMLDNKFSYTDSRWYKDRWTIEFTQANVNGDTNWKYQVYSDTTRSGNLNSANEVAKDPQNPSKFLSAGWNGISDADAQRVTDSLNLGKKFGITGVSFSAGCNANGNQSISFDEKGRPYRKVSTIGGGGSADHMDRRLTQDCNITLSDGDGVNNRAIITVYKETGYVELVQFPTSL